MAEPPAATAQAVTVAPLIERVQVLRQPDAHAGQISPDGQWLSWIAPRDGVLNVWVAPAGDPAKAARADQRDARGRSAQLLLGPGLAR